MEIRLETITPQRAAELLEMNTGNRALRRATVEAFARAILAGQWASTHQAIAINGSELLDGQHRLSAIVRAGVPVEMFVAYGVPSGAKKHIDTGASRTVADVIKLAYGDSNGAKLQALATTWHLLDGGGLGRRWQAWEVEESHDLHAEESTWASDRFNVRGFNSGLFLGVLSWAYPCYPGKISEFYAMVSTGNMLASGSPALRLREWVLTNKGQGGVVSRKATALRILTAARAHVEGRTLRVFGVAAGGYDFFAGKRRLPKDARKWAADFVARYGAWGGRSG